MNAAFAAALRRMRPRERRTPAAVDFCLRVPDRLTFGGVPVRFDTSTTAVGDGDEVVRALGTPPHAITIAAPPTATLRACSPRRMRHPARARRESLPIVTMSAAL